MTRADALRILGALPGEDVRAIKSRFRALIRRYHPDAADAADAEIARKLIEAYRVLLNEPDGGHDAQGFWKAQVNPAAFCERPVFVKYHFFEDEDLPPIETARGKYLWQPELEDFALFSRSVLLICRELMTEAMERGLQPDIRELFYLLSQEYIDPVGCMRTLSEEATHRGGMGVYSFFAHVKVSGRDIRELSGGSSAEEPLEVTVRERTALVRRAGERLPLGQLSFDEDCLYPVLLPVLARNDVRAEAVVKKIRNDNGKRSTSVLTVALTISIGDDVTEIGPECHAKQIREMIGRR